jgi:cell division septal protein FtsQ
MFFGKKSPKRLYYPTNKKWYTQPRRRKMPSRSRKVFTHNIKTHFTRFFKNAIYFTITGAILVCFVIILFFSSYLAVTNIEVVREDFNIDTATIGNQLNQYVGSNILFFPKSKIIDTIQENFPEFASIKVNKIFPHTLKIYLESHEIVANLRAFYVLPKAEIPPEEHTIKEVQKALETAFSLEDETAEKEELNPIEQRCLINRIGQAIFDQEENLELITVTIDDLTQPIEDREIIIPKEGMDYILDAVHYFNNLFKMQVRAVRYLPIAREIHIKTDSNIVIWLTMAKDYREQIDKLNTIYEVAELDKEDIAYIDLRVKEKVIYCNANSRCNR